MSELEDLRRAFHKLANRDFTGLVVAERAKGAKEMRERAAKLVEDRYPLDDGEALDLAEDIRSLPIDPETGGE